MGIFTTRATKELEHLRAANAALTATNLRLSGELARLQEEVDSLGSVSAASQFHFLRNALLESNKRSMAVNRELERVSRENRQLKESVYEGGDGGVVRKRPSLPAMMVVAGPIRTGKENLYPFQAGKRSETLKPTCASEDIKGSGRQRREAANRLLTSGTKSSRRWQNREHADGAPGMPGRGILKPASGMNLKSQIPTPVKRSSEKVVRV